MPPALPHTDWPDWRFEAAAARSVIIHGNRAVLPAAGCVLELGASDVTASEVVRGLQGRVAPNKALEALERLCAIGALEELPRLGRPHARVFKRRANAYWSLVAEELDDLERSDREPAKSSRGRER